MKPEEFYVRLADLGFPLTDRQKEQYERYFELLVDAQPFSGFAA